jgi:deoxyribonuclease V
VVLTPEEALAQQQLLRKCVVLEETWPHQVRIIAGADVEYDKYSNQVAGAIVLLDACTLAVLEVATHVSTCDFPYIPGLFSYRELPPLLEAYYKLSQRPDLIICDGHGLAHPRRFGLASHLGVTVNVPTIGCAKNRLVGYYSSLASQRGATVPLIDEYTGEMIGAVLRTQTDIKPLFISVGHRITLPTAIEMVLTMSPTVRLPETTRQADKYAREALNRTRETQ